MNTPQDEFFSTTPEQRMEEVRKEAEALVHYALALGFVLTITQRSLEPLAMTNYETVVEVRPDRRVGAAS